MKTLHISKVIASYIVNQGSASIITLGFPGAIFEGAKPRFQQAPIK